MLKDPVCGAQVDETTAQASSTYQGQKYSFCGSDCKQKFDKNPERYAPGQQQQQQQQGKGQQQGQGQQQGKHEPVHHR